MSADRGKLLSGSMNRWWAGARAYLDARLELDRGGSHNVPPMEGLRGYAVFLVFLVHYAALSAPWIATNSITGALSSFLHQAGQSGVDLFFVLSGYLIYGALISKPIPFFVFMRRRVKRLYPAFACVTVLYLALSFLFPHESKIPHRLAAAMTYVVANALMLPGMLSIQPMITVAWSLSYEIFYYLMIPLLIASLRLRQWSASQRVAFFASGAIVLVILAPHIGGRARLDMFLSGILLFETVRGGLKVPQPAVLAASALIISLIVMAPTHGPLTNLAMRIGVLFVAYYFLCLACFAAPSDLAARAFSWTPLRWLGNMSYSYYLIHGVTLKMIFLVLARIYPGHGGANSIFWMGMAPAFLITLAVSATLFLAVERPFSLQAFRAKPKPPVASREESAASNAETTPRLP